jgi:DNA-binding PadR family transcriptional regulator
MYSNDNWGNFNGSKGWHHGGHRAKRGDMGPIILRLLKEKSMHGYEIISRLEEKSHGMWRPSAGSIYPNLQLLEEQDLVTSELQNSKKVYSLTSTGKEVADKAEEAFKAPWEENADHAKNFKDLKLAFFDIMPLLHQIASQASEKKNQEVKKILLDAKNQFEKLVDQEDKK